MEFINVFWKIVDAKGAPRYISNKGGTRSTKTYSILQFLYLLISQNDTAGDITSVDLNRATPEEGAIRTLRTS